MIPEYLSPLANHLWQSTLFAGAAGLLALALRKNHASLRYGIWLTASVKFLVPFSLLVSIGSQLQWRPSPGIVQSPLISVMDEITYPFAYSVSEPALNIPSTPAESSSAGTSAVVPIALLSVWLCGVAVVAFSWLREWRRMRLVLRTASPLNLNIPIQVMSSAVRVEPGIVGVFRPVLLLPDGLTERLTPAQLQPILVHELCHVRRRDNLAAALHMAVEMVFWFHPLVWWIESRLVEERERACDEEVLRATGQPESYAEGILTVCRFYKESSLVCRSGVTGANLKKRIETIMNPRALATLGVPKMALLASAGVAVVAGPILLGSVSGLAQAPSSAVTVPELVSTSPQETSEPQAAPLSLAESALLQPSPLASPVAARVDTAQARAEFEVASVRRNTSGSGSMRVSSRPGGVTITNQTLGALIRDAFGFKDHLLSGPDWLATERYDIVAKAPEGIPETEMDKMMQAFLTDRFKIAFRREIREVPIYALVVAEDGLKLQEADSRDDDGFTGSPFGVGLHPLASGLSFSQGMGTMQALADSLSRNPNIGRPVVDKTGLTARYTRYLEYRRNDAPPEVIGPSIFTALEEQLGVKLEPDRGLVEYVIIEHIERPSEN